MVLTAPFWFAYPRPGHAGDRREVAARRSRFLSARGFHLIASPSRTGRCAHNTLPYVTMNVRQNTLPPLAIRAPGTYSAHVMMPFSKRGWRRDGGVADAYVVAVSGDDMVCLTACGDRFAHDLASLLTGAPGTPTVRVCGKDQAQNTQARRAA